MFRFDSNPYNQTYSEPTLSKVSSIINSQFFSSIKQYFLWLVFLYPISYRNMISFEQIKNNALEVFLNDKPQK